MLEQYSAFGAIDQSKKHPTLKCTIVFSTNCNQIRLKTLW